MTISMYQASVPRLINALTNLSNVLQKAHDHMTEKKIDANAILHYRHAEQRPVLTGAAKHQRAGQYVAALSQRAGRPLCGLPGPCFLANKCRDIRFFGRFT